MSYRFVIKGTAFHSLTPETFEVLENHLFCVDRNGTLAAVLHPADSSYAVELAAAKAAGILRCLKEGQFLLPGFIDTHLHAPQWAQVGKALDADLPIWLNDYTFPLEAAYTDLDFAAKIYADLVTTLLANGTTTAQYFGSVDNEPNKLLADLCAAKGQRAFIGKVVLDLSTQCPVYYRDGSADTALAATEAFLTYTARLNRRTPQDIVGVVTPRFIPTCSDDALYGLGRLAAEYDAPIQSHCSEGDWEQRHVSERVGMSDTRAHEKFGLLTDRTTLAHSVYLSDEDAALYREKGTAITHCPLSNILFANAVCPVKKRLDQGLTVSLATDLSAGYTPSMFDAMRQAILSSRTLQYGIDYRLASEKRGVADSAIDFRHAFYMATAGGAKTLHINCGQFKKGFHFDAFIFDCQAPLSNSRYYENDSLTAMLQKIIFTGNRQNIVALWVQGRQIIPFI